MREKIINEWNIFAEKWDSKSRADRRKISKDLYLEASQKNDDWKEKVINRMIRVAKADRRIDEQAIERIVTISKKINAKKECSRIFKKEFGYDPFS